MTVISLVILFSIQKEKTNLTNDTALVFEALKSFFFQNINGNSKIQQFFCPELFTRLKHKLRIIGFLLIS